MYEDLSEMLAKVGDAIKAVGEAAIKAIKALIPITILMRELLKKYNIDILMRCPNKRVVHLALHSKKCRVRKKNINRARRIVERREK